MAQHMWRRLALWPILVLLAFAMLACGDSDDTPSATAVPTAVAWQVSTTQIEQSTAQNLQLLGRFDEHNSTVFQMAFSADGRYLATISVVDRRVIVWDMQTGDIAGNVGTLDPAWAFFDPDANYLYVIDRNQRISQWDMATGNEVESRAAQGDGAVIGSIAFDGNGNRVATAGARGQIYVLDLQPFETVAMIDAHPVVPVYSISMNADGTLLASLGDDRAARVWDVATNTLRFEVTELINPRLIALSPSGDLMAISTENAIQLYTVEDGASVGNLPIPAGSAEVAMLFSSNGQRIISYGTDSSVYVWDLATRDLWVELPNHQRGVKRAILSDDGNLMLSVSGAGAVYLWDLSTVNDATGNDVDIRRADLPVPDDAEVHDVLWAPDERLVVVADFIGRVLILGVPD